MLYAFLMSSILSPFPSTIFYPGPIPERYNLLPSCQCLPYNPLPTLTNTSPYNLLPYENSPSTIFYLMKTKPTYDFLLSSCSLSLKFSLYLL